MAGSFDFLLIWIQTYDLQKNSEDFIYCRQLLHCACISIVYHTCNNPEHYGRNMVGWTLDAKNFA